MAACNVDAALAVVAQDWAGDRFLSKPADRRLRELGYAEKSDTNKNLHVLLRTAFGLELGGVYATNAFPFIKAGEMNAGIPMRDLVRAIRDFALPEVEIVAPRMTICIGTRTFNAFRRALGHAAVTEADMSDGPTHFSHRGIEFAGVPHCGRIVTNRIGMAEATRLWRLHAERFRA